MKTGRSLEELVTELDRQAASRVDIVVPTTRLRALGEGGTALDIPGEGTLELTEHAHAQLAAELDIPRQYYARMRESAQRLWAENVGHWLAAQERVRLVRTIDRRIRGIMSDAYRPLDNFELTAKAIIPALRTLGDARVESCQITESRLYIKLVRPSIQWDAAMAKREALIKAGASTHLTLDDPDVLQAALTIRNSEVGDGALAIEAGVFALRCLNLATSTVVQRTKHVGRRHRNQDGEDDVYRLLSDEAREADDTAYWLRCRDVIQASLTEERFMLSAGKYAHAAGDRLTGDVEKVVEATAVKFGLSDATRSGVLKSLIESGDLSRLGVANAITAQSQREADYETASALERVGGRVIELAPGDWKLLNVANGQN